MVLGTSSDEYDYIVTLQKHWKAALNLTEKQETIMTSRVNKSLVYLGLLLCDSWDNDLLWGNALACHTQIAFPMSWWSVDWCCNRLYLYSLIKYVRMQETVIFVELASSPWWYKYRGCLLRLIQIKGTISQGVLTAWLPYCAMNAWAGVTSFTVWFCSSAIFHIWWPHQFKSLSEKEPNSTCSRVIFNSVSRDSLAVFIFWTPSTFGTYLELTCLKYIV